MKWIIALLIFSVLVLFHEFGHFLVAKLNGVEVEEFSLGFGPRLLSVVAGGTRYSVKLLWFGGSCQMKGMLEEYDDEAPREPAVFQFPSGVPVRGGGDRHDGRGPAGDPARGRGLSRR